MTPRVDPGGRRTATTPAPPILTITPGSPVRFSGGEAPLVLTYSTIVFLPGSTLELVEASEVLVQVADAGQAAVLAAASSPPPTWVADTAVVWNLPAPASVVISPAAGLTLNGGVTLSLG